MSPETKTAYRHAIGETKLVCRDVSMRAVQSLGTRLVEGYVLYGAPCSWSGAHERLRRSRPSP
jgi:hypothetical protein